MSGDELTLANRYRVLRELGRGGMAAVYLAHDTRYDRQVAVKVLSGDVAHGVLAERFLREIAVAAKLTHPHIVPLLDSGATDDRIWFVMPLLEGRSLRDRLAAEGPLPIAEAVRAAAEVASALAYAHAHGVVHRDIKPENVLLSGGSAAVADFGLAKAIEGVGAERGATLTSIGTVVGTPAYMSPEQALGDRTVDGRTDIYSLGCLLYEMLTGEPPYVGFTPQAVMAKRFSDPVPSARRLRPTVPPALDAVVERALGRDPVDRQQTADEFAAQLADAVAGSSPGNRAWSPLLRATHRHARIAAAAVVVLIVLAIAGVAFAKRGAQAAGARTPRAIAVLPFANLSDDRSQEYFSAGMTDELLDALSSIRQLRVAARASSYALRGQEGDLAGIARKLGVQAVLEGTVARDGDSVRVSAELVSVPDGFRIWGGSYDRRITDVFAMQEELARAIVSAIRLELGDQQPVVHKPTDDLAAYETYLRGRHALDTRTPAAVRDAITYYRQAVDRDPLYARAWSGLADAYILQGLNYYAAPADAYPRGKAAAERALALDSTLAEAHTSLGTVRWLYDRDFAGAAASYARAIALDPKYPAVHYFNAIFLVDRDQRRSDSEADLARSLDPLSPPMAQAPGMVRVNSGRYADAVPLLRSAIALEPNYYFPHAWLALALVNSGAPDSALAEVRRAVDLNPTNNLVLGYLGEVYATTGDRARALAVAARLDTLSRTQPVCDVFVARIYDRLGDADRAFAWLHRAVAAHEGQLTQITWPNTFIHIRSDPRFLPLVRQLGLERQ